MFLQSLHGFRKSELFKLARLLLVFDAPLLWSGKTQSEIDMRTDLKDISFSLTDVQKSNWQNMLRCYGESSEDSSGGYLWSLDEDAEWVKVDKQLLSEIRGMNLISRQIDVAERLKAAQQILQEVILKESALVLRDLRDLEELEAMEKSSSLNLPQIMKLKRLRELGASKRGGKCSVRNGTQSRIVLFEAMRASFDNGGLTDSKKNLLQMASVAYDIDGESFNELLVQAAALHREMKRSINLVLE